MNTEDLEAFCKEQKMKKRTEKSYLDVLPKVYKYLKCTSNDDFLKKLDVCNLDKLQEFLMYKNNNQHKDTTLDVMKKRLSNLSNYLKINKIDNEHFISQNMLIEKKIEVDKKKIEVISTSSALKLINDMKEETLIELQDKIIMFSHAIVGCGRSDLYTIKIGAVDKSKDNFYEKKQFVFNDMVKNKLKKKLIIELPESLDVLIQKRILLGGVYLVTDKKTKTGYSNANGYCKRVMAISKIVLPEYKESWGVIKLRSVVTTNNFADTKENSVEELKAAIEIAPQMNHSAKTNISNYRKTIMKDEEVVENTLIEEDKITIRINGYTVEGSIDVLKKLLL